jgi:YjbR
LTEQAGVPQEILAELRAVCLGLPEAYEEQAWVGTRWRIRKRTFAHVLTVESGWPSAYARAAATNGPVTVLMFRSSGPELAALAAAGHPFFMTPWRADEVGIMLDEGAGRDEVAELVTESYCVVAPRRLADLVVRPTE